jgi:hypothetical protein
VRQAFLRLEKQGDGHPSAGELAIAWEQWKALPNAEQRRILNGWQPNETLPSRASLLERSPYAALFLEGEIDRSGRVTLSPEVEIDEGSVNPLRVLIREGTDKATAVCGLRVILAAVEAHFEDAVGLKLGELLATTAALRSDALQAANVAFSAAQEAIENARKSLELVFSNTLRMAATAIPQVAREAPNRPPKKKPPGSTRTRKLGGRGREKTEAATR